MSKIAFGENFSSSLLLSTFLGAVVVTTGFMCSASAMEGVHHDGRRSPSSLPVFLENLPNNPDFLALPKEQKDNFQWELSYGPLRMELDRNLEGTVKKVYQTDEEKVRLVESWLKSERDLADYIEFVKASATFHTLPEQDKMDFKNAMRPAGTGPLARFNPIQSSSDITPREKIDGIKVWLADCVAKRQEQQEMDQFLTQVRTHPSYLSLTAEDWAAFDYELNEGTGKFSLSYTENQRPAVRMTKIKEWLADRQADRQAFNEMKRFLANVEAHPQFLSLKAEDWAAFDYELTGTGSLSTSYAENQRPAVRMAKIKAWLEARRLAR